MKVSLLLALFTALGISGCASAPFQPRVAPWPDSVSETCPQRDRHLECFRQPSIRDAMHGLIPRFRACHPLSDESVKIRLVFETRGGAPTCVEGSPPKSPTARCLAEVVAHHFELPDSSPEATCSIDFPMVFE
jgi:hypothetical protein